MSRDVMKIIDPPILDAIFSSFIMPINEKLPNLVYENHGIIYKLNNYGFRSDDFYKSGGILYSGCSVTYGTGLPSDKIWNVFLNKKIKNAEMLNLSLPGQSISKIIYDVYDYIDNFGKPKCIFILFPDILRFPQVSYDLEDRAVVSTSLLHNNSLEFAEMTNEEVKGVKKIVTESSLLYTAVKEISMLEKYLDLLNIPFLWATWDEELNYLLKRNNFKNYFEIVRDDMLQYVLENYKTYDKDEKDLWLKAADLPIPHPGIVYQKYYAECFYNEAKKRGILSSLENSAAE
jgi:hypothetical protein